MTADTTQARGRVTEEMVEAAAAILMGRVNAPEQELYAAARAALEAALSRAGEPVDPHFNGIPAVGVLEEIKMAHEAIKNDPTQIDIWRPILSRLHPSFVQQCTWAIERSKTFVEETLKANMFASLTPGEQVTAAHKVRDRLTDLNNNKGHDRHFQIDECQDMGLHVVPLEGDQKLQDLVLTIHHCYMHTLANTAAFKIIENHDGKAMVRQQQIIATPTGGAAIAP